MPTGAFTEKKDTDRLNLGVPGDAPAWLDSMRRTLDFQLKQLAYRACAGKLEGVRLAGGALVVSPLESGVPDAAEALKWELNSFLPNVHITDLLAEVDGWTGFADKFTHLRIGDMVRNRSAILAAVLADATNLGPKRMAEASSNVSERQISWARLFHVRPETYRAAQAAIIYAHSAHPHAALWGAGATSSSDGQFFRASDRAAGRSDVNLHYGSEPGTKFYSHLSDQYGYFSILPISPSESEAPYVLDGLFDDELKLDIDEHYTDTGGSSDHVFGLFALLGRRFAPRLRNLKDRKFHAFEKPDAYPALKAHLGPRINIDLIRDNWDELLRMAASMNERIVAPSTILKKLSASKRRSELARALREVGRLERSRFMVEWYCDPFWRGMAALRARTSISARTSPGCAKVMARPTWPSSATSPSTSPSLLRSRRDRRAPSPAHEPNPPKTHGKPASGDAENTPPETQPASLPSSTLKPVNPDLLPCPRVECSHATGVWRRLFERAL